MDNVSPFEPTVLGAMWKYKWLVSFVVLVLSGLAVAYALFSPVSYQAVSSLVVEDPRASSLFDIGNTQNPQRYVADQAAILLSGSVAERASSTEPELDDAEHVLAGLEVFFDDGSNVIDVVYTSDDPDVAVAAANAVAAAYEEIRLEATSASFSEALAQLEDSTAQVEAQIVELQAQITQEIESDPSRNALDQQMSDALARLVELQADLDTATGSELDGLRGELDDVFRQLQTYQLMANIQDDDPALAALLEEQRQTVERKADLLQRQDELSVEARLASSGIVLSSPAIAANAVGVDPTRMLAIGLMLGLLLAAGIAYLLALRNRVFDDRSEPQIVLGVPLIAEVPSFREEKIKGELPVRTDPTSVAAESFRFIAAGLEVEADAGTPGTRPSHMADPYTPLVRTFAVVSPSLGDGKTTVAINTALASARQGKRVLAIDADFGHQQMSSLLTDGHPPEHGLTDLVEQSMPFNYVVERIPVPGGATLDLMARGSVPVTAPDFFRSAGVRTFFEGIGEEYDLIVIDTPPLLHVAYASPVVRYADRTVVVVSHGRKVGPSEELASRLEFLETGTIGYVYNRAPMREAVQYGGSLQDVLGQPRVSPKS